MLFIAPCNTEENAKTRNVRGNPLYINNMRHCNFLYKCYKTSFNSVCRSCNCMVNILLVRSIYFKKQPKL